MIAGAEATRSDEPVAGTVLNLQAMADNAPKVYSSKSALKTNSTSGRTNAVVSEGYVTGGKQQEAPRQVVIDDTDEVTPVATTPAASNKRVNIADEKPVEETIAEERAKKTSTAAVSKKDESKMSALDKLKAHMDKTVYAESEQKFEPKASGKYSPGSYNSEAKEETVTTPARRNSNMAAVRETRTPEKKTKEAAKNERVKPNAKTKAKSHTVRKGESLFEIAEKYDLTVAQLQKINKLNSKKITPGMKLKVAK